MNNSTKPRLNHTFSCLLRPFFGFETGSYSERRTATYLFPSTVKSAFFEATPPRSILHTPEFLGLSIRTLMGDNQQNSAKDIILGKGLLSKQVPISFWVLRGSITAFQFNSSFQGRDVEFSICPPVFLVATHISRTNPVGISHHPRHGPWGKLVSCKSPFSPWVWQDGAFRNEGVGWSSCPRGCGSNKFCFFFMFEGTIQLYKLFHIFFNQGGEKTPTIGPSSVIM